MLSCKATTSKLPTLRLFKLKALPITSTRNMAFFSRIPQGDFAPLFRLLDDYDTHRSSKSNGFSSIRAFSPKFDVKEVKDGYELHGELPGVDQKDVSIEFTDPHTLVIKGRTEREYTSGTPPAIEGGAQHAQIEDSSKSSHHATVEDEDAGETTIAKASSQEVANKQPEAPKSKYWVSERSVGEFHRSFSFPSRVDQDAVKASLKNGILSIIVPKATTPSSRKINIE